MLKPGEDGYSLRLLLNPAKKKAPSRRNPRKPMLTCQFRKKIRERSGYSKSSFCSEG